MRRAALTAALVAAAGTARAGGLERPNGIGARAVGQGGAFVAVADDATAWHWNPGAAALTPPSLVLGGELVIAPRSYTPIDAAGTRGEPQSPDTPIAPIPTVAVTTRLSPRVAVGGGVWNTYGGQLRYPRTGAPAIDATQELVLEGAIGVAYRVTPRLAIGATARIGLGLFSVETTQRPVDSEVSGSGVGLGVGLGLAWRPHPRLAIGATWRSGITIETTGEGQLDLGGGLTADMQHTQRWPQSAELGVAVAVTPTVRMAAQLDWTGWSRFERLEVRFPAQPPLDQIYALDWEDSLSGRLGVEWGAAPNVSVRGGVYVDGNAVPDRTIERQYLDSTKVGGAIGGGVRLGPWRVDAAFDLVAGPPRVVDDNRGEVGPWGTQANVAPGEHDGSVYTLELTVGRAL